MFSSKALFEGYERGKRNASQASSPDGEKERILKFLRENSGMTVFELAVRLTTKPERIAGDLDVLAKTQLVDRQGEGDDAFVRITPEGIAYLES